MTGALDGVRVLDLSDQQGAFAGKLLAGLGADVVLVEPPGGSPLRSIPPFWQGVEGPERSLFFWFYSAGKRGLTLDWRTAAGAATLSRLAARADVLIESEPPGTCSSAPATAAWRLTSTSWPRPVVSRARSALTTPTAAKMPAWW